MGEGRDKLFVENVSSSFIVALGVTILVFQWRDTSGFLFFTFDEGLELLRVVFEVMAHRVH